MKKKKKQIIILLIIISLLIIMYFNISLINEKIQDLYISFRRTLLDEHRYLLMLEGLKSTMIISFSSIILGSLSGMIICYFRTMNYKVSRNITKFIISLIQGMPLTVLLLIFYYVIFGTIDIEPMLVAIITFSIYFSVYTAEIYRGAINSINKSQIISAYALGFSKLQTLIYIMLPQVLSYVIPVYKNECVSLIKLTSIAGYISIIDLTKASDIIRNRTYEAFFPLIFTAFVYFVICFLVEKILDSIYRKINPKGSKIKSPQKI